MCITRPSAAQHRHQWIQRTCAHLLDVSAPAEPAGAEDTARMRVHLPPSILPHCPVDPLPRAASAAAPKRRNVYRLTSSSAIKSRFAPRTSVTIRTTCARHRCAAEARARSSRLHDGRGGSVRFSCRAAEAARHACVGGWSCGEILAGYRRCVRAFAARVQPCCMKCCCARGDAFTT